jgi:hypothetical protein
MAKGKNDKGVFGPVSGRLPMAYGEENELRKMNTKRPAEESAELARTAPKHQPIASGEGPAGRHYESQIKVSKEAFNEERKKAT